MPLIESWKIIGAYAQTELGHGSNVRGLELEARWDSRTKEFVLHSPTLTASKWWNGSLGRTANHAIVVAQLLLPAPGSPEKYVSYGPHPFIVQVRDMKTHQPLDGVVIGDIGPKYGCSTIDNAYMLFENFRLVSTTMLDASPSVLIALPLVSRMPPCFPVTLVSTLALASTRSPNNPLLFTGR